jgi:hypothetical protein
VGDEELIPLIQDGPVKGFGEVINGLLGFSCQVVVAALAGGVECRRTADANQAVRAFDAGNEECPAGCRATVEGQDRLERPNISFLASRANDLGQQRSLGLHL